MDSHIPGLGHTTLAERIEALCAHYGAVAKKAWADEQIARAAFDPAAPLDIRRTTYAPILAAQKAREAAFHEHATLAYHYAILARGTWPAEVPYDDEVYA